MDYEQLQQYRKSLLDRALSEGLRRNDEQCKIWSEYRERHEKVILGLETFQPELAVECMVPIGKKALMRGKLTHTNEILVFLGDGYFAKYSAAQAIALCNRRIKRANDLLEGLEKERDLFVSRQMISDSFDAFGGEERKDLVEYWDNEKLDDWRVKHREREKEYRKKLSELKNTEKTEIQTEEDLFKRLDALELQEELEDELYRLEAAHPDFYEQDLEDGEAYEESESDADSDNSDTTNDDKEEDNNEKLVTSDIEESSVPRNDNFPVDKTETPDKTNAAVISCQESRSGSEQLIIPNSSNTSSDGDSSRPAVREKKVVFGEPQVKYFDNGEKLGMISQSRSEAMIETTVQKNSNNIDDTNDEDDDDVIRINVKHTDHEPEIPATDDDSIQSPRDIYKMLSRPKSILKKSSNHVIASNINISPIDEDPDEEIDDDSVSGASMYSTVVKDIREHAVTSVDTIGSVEPKRPVSKFKRERAGKK